MDSVYVKLLAKFTQVNYYTRARNTRAHQFITLPFSHYVDFARWTLEASNAKFEEHGFAPGQHILAVINVRVNGDEKQKRISNSSFVEPVRKVGAETRPVSEKKQTVARSTAVPLLVTTDGTVLCDSWSIAEYCGYESVPTELKKLLDEELGPLSRQRAYHFVLKKQNYDVWTSMCTDDKGWLWGSLWFLFGPKLTGLMIKIFRTSDEESAKECRRKLEVVSDKLSVYLSEKKGMYLSNTDQPGTADFALAALTGPLVNPPQYCNGIMNVVTKTMEERDVHLQDEVAYWRSTEIGKHCLMMYEQHKKY